MSCLLIFQQNLLFAAEPGPGLSQEDFEDYASWLAYSGNCANYPWVKNCPPCDCNYPASNLVVSAGGNCQWGSSQSTYGTSYIDNLSFSYTHYTKDWTASSSVEGCASCGVAGASNGVPVLSLPRFHRFRDMTEQSSFGPGVFCGYDINLSITDNGGFNRVRVFDPATPNMIVMDDGRTFRGDGDALDGVFKDQLTHTFKSFHLTDDFGGAGSLVTDVAQAKGAVITNKAGYKFYFDVIRGVTQGESVAGAPDLWKSVDIGQVNDVGFVEYDSGKFTVEASGKDIQGNSDEFHMVYQALQGDGSITARVLNIENTDGWAKFGVMMRESLAADAKNATVLVTPNDKVTFQKRTTTAGGTWHTSVSNSTFPKWVRLTRVGDAITAAISDDNVTWTDIQTETVAMNTDIYILESL